jgi:NAD(P)H-dependent FMN reductase
MKTVSPGILAISGSLRSNSSNTRILKLIASLIPENIRYTVFEHIDSLPHFNPGLDDDHVPAAVTAFRRQLNEADGIIICTPEYAFGVPGTLKNALDWIVSSYELGNKPTALITASSRGEKAHASLLLTLQALNASIVQDGTLLISFIRSKMNDDGEVTDADTLHKIQAVANALVHAISEKIPASS